MDAVEAERGFEPPLFVDIRISRSVRAEGFSGTAFEETVGEDRYVWMDDLGNEAIKTGKGRIRIRNPNAAEVLLTLALENARRPRRVIFFCSCEWPVWGGGRHCHRVTVGSLLLKAAGRRDTRITVAEWPGGEPREAKLKRSSAEARKIRKTTTIPIGRLLPDPDLLGLAWGSLVHIRAAEDSASYFVGPPRFSGGTWAFLKLADGLEKEDSLERGLMAGEEWRRRWGFCPLA
jgi:hypothetical protein